MIQENEKAPDFKLKDQGGNTVRLKDFAGKPLVLYFYPRDDTPGCTTEACSFRDDYSIYKEMGAEIVGVSADDEESHTKFVKKYDLPFTLLADTDHEVCEKYGVWVKKNKFGKEYYGIKRTTFLIDGDRKVAKVFEGVKPASHSAEVIEAVRELA